MIVGAGNAIHLWKFPHGFAKQHGAYFGARRCRMLDDFDGSTRGFAGFLYKSLGAVRRSFVFLQSGAEKDEIAAISLNKVRGHRVADLLVVETDGHLDRL